MSAPPALLAHDVPEVVVLGGGPAGCVAARLLAAWGHDVVLVTRAPARLTFAESLPPSATKLLDRVGMLGAVDGAGFIRATGNTVRWAGGAERVERFPGGALGYQVPRDRFDALLLEAAEAAGARTIDGVSGRVSPGRDARGLTEVRYASSEHTGKVRAPWVLDCTGRSGAARPRSRAGHAGDAPRTLALVGVWESERWALPDETHTLVESCDGGWAWSVPATPARRYVTLMVDPALTHLQGRRRIAAQYREQLARTEWIGPLVTGAGRMIGSPWACDASQYRAADVAGEGLLRVGDAASFVDPLSSFGLKKALASGWLAAVVVHTCLVDPSLAGEATALYARREREMYGALAGASAALARAARETHAGGFWRARSQAEGAAGGGEGGHGEGDLAALRGDPRVRAAFADLKSRAAIRLGRADGVKLLPRAVVEGNRVVLRDHLVAGAFPGGVRYVRDVDLPLLVAIAPEHDQVGALYDAYARAAAPVPLPNFLGALSTLIGMEVLILA